MAGVQHAEGRETWPGAGAGVGQRRQGWPAFLSLCMAPFSSDMYSSQGELSWGCGSAGQCAPPALARASSLWLSGSAALARLW